MSLHCFQIPFVVLDAPALVRFPCGYGAVSPASLNLVTTNGFVIDEKCSCHVSTPTSYVYFVGRCANRRRPAAGTSEGCWRYAAAGPEWWALRIHKKCTTDDDGSCSCLSVHWSRLSLDRKLSSLESDRCSMWTVGVSSLVFQNQSLKASATAVRIRKSRTLIRAGGELDGWCHWSLCTIS